jgi:biotin operon repressor
LNEKWSSKKGLHRRLLKLLKRRLIRPDGEFTLAFVLASWANDAGKVWLGVDRLADETGLSDRGIQKVLGRLKEKGIIEAEMVKRGESLPSGMTAIRDREVYVLAEAVCGIARPLSKPPGSDDHDSPPPVSDDAKGWPPPMPNDGEPSSPRGFSFEGEQSSPLLAAIEGVLCSSEPSSSPSVNAVPEVGERRAPPLHDPNPREEKTDPKGAGAPAGREHPKEGLRKLSLQIQKKERIDPRFLRETVNSAIEDGIALEPIVKNVIAQLEENGKAETTSLGKIEWVAWTEPTDLKTLLDLPPPPRGTDVDAMIAEFKAKMAARVPSC